MSRFQVSLLASVIVLAAGAAGLYLYTQAGSRDAQVFPGIAGPQQVTVVPPPMPARWEQYGEGAPSALAILLTNPDRAAKSRMGYVELGAIYSPGKDLDLAVGIIRNIMDGAARTTQVTAGLTWRFR